MKTTLQKSGILLVCACFFLVSCSSRLGWGVLLWSTEDPAIPSGTVLSVYIRSNIDRVWVVGIPEGLRGVGGTDRIEIPLSRLEFTGSRKNALRRANAFADVARTYAENLQDGLPIRDNPDNNARRVYRLRTGEIIKILAPAQGVPPISTTGDPLPGSWYQVLTEDGTVGYCFSFRLNLFEHHSGQLAASVPESREIIIDPNLDALMSRTWVFESYLTMINQRRINLEDISRNWHFDPGQDSGIARILAPGVDRSFSYTAIRSDGVNSWYFEETSLSMQRRSDTTLAVQFTEESGGTRTLLFVSLAADIDDLIVQETARRERLYNAIFSQGPVFTSNNFGTITFRADGTFTWRGFDLLVPQHIPETIAGQGSEARGTVLMDLFLVPVLEDRYNGAFTLRFTQTGGRQAILRCMYSLDNQGFRIEIVPESSIEDGVTIARRAPSPMVLFFFRDEGLW